ncbi:MAG: glutamine--fructose-6-phosphate transaminase (isomerizing), partial [Candidatus Kerfeldbacteria bacterium]|nr:glutamine--fructose-6-phosphate transaminase (isomerizing) [Candidatus Kerfeldbacteria bacterium]
MCGIIAYRGPREVLPILMDGLHRMEYRGYDSAGIAVVQPNGIALEKRKGKLDVLAGTLKDKTIPGTVGIGHIRWATHGAPSDVNAHPHADAEGKIVVVHNGIIENANALRTQLEGEGVRFVSETDTEIFAHLIARELRNGGALEDAVHRTLMAIRGAYGIAVLSRDEPEKIVAARFGSPLILGIVGDGEYIVASDVTAILRHTRRVIYLEDGDVVTLTPNAYMIHTRGQTPIERTPEQIDWDIAAAEKGNHPHFMKKEIYEQPAGVQMSMQGRVLEDEGLAKLGGLEHVADQLREAERLVIVACGTAYHAGLVGEYMIEEYARVPVEVITASEFRYKQLLPDHHTAYLAISQSGETADTIAALQEVKRQGGLTLGIVNVVGSTVSRITDAGVYNHIGPEIAVASTKAFTSQLTVLALLTLVLARQRKLSLAQGQRIVRELAHLPAKIEAILRQDEHIRDIAYRYAQSENMLYLGRKYNYPIALEGALKLKEIAYTHAEGYPAGEMKHGPIALIEESFPTVVIAPQDSVYEKNVSNIEEVRARRGPIIAVATEGDAELAKRVDDIMEIPKTLEMLTPILSVVPLQLFAYH